MNSNFSERSSLRKYNRVKKKDTQCHPLVSTCCTLTTFILTHPAHVHNQHPANHLTQDTQVPTQKLKQLEKYNPQNLLIPVIPPITVNCINLCQEFRMSMFTEIKEDTNKLLNEFQTRNKIK